MKRNFIIGIFVIVALCILFVGIEFLKGINIFQASNNYYAVYTDVQGLQESAPVTLNGYKVGQVSKIEYMYDNPGHVKVEFSLDKELKVMDGSKAEIEVALLGTASVKLTMGTSNKELPSGSELQAALAPGMMDKVTSEVLPSITNIVPSVDTLLNNVNAVVTNPSLEATLNNLEEITASLAQTMQAVNGVVKGVPSVMSNVQEISSELKQVSENLTTFTAKLNELPLDSTMMNVMEITENLATLTNSLNQTESTIGKLLHDDGFYQNINSVAQSLDSLITDIKKNPKRYISIKLL